MGKRNFVISTFQELRLEEFQIFSAIENGLSVIKPAPYKERKSQGRYSRKGHFNDKRLEFLKDIEAKLMEGKGKGYVTWAKRFNAKQMAKTVLFLQEHKIESYEQLKEMTDERSGRLK